jgi:hypothetical protein
MVLVNLMMPLSYRAYQKGKKDAVKNVIPISDTGGEYNIWHRNAVRKK